MKKNLFFTFVFLFLTILFPSFVNADVLFGKVVGIVDGDTITVLTESKAQKQIRIKGIDAPEKEQVFGINAREYLSNLVLNKKIKVEYESLIEERQILGKVFLDGKDIGLEMLKNGFAWFCEDHKNDLSEEEISLYLSSQSKANYGALGLWKNSNPITPWNFREQNVNKSKVQNINSVNSINNFTGIVTDILSGIKMSIVKFDQSKLEVCISNLEVPENGQPYADEAQQHLKDLILNQNIRIKLKGLGSGCLEADVYLNDININLQMVRDGVAWSNKNYYYPEGFNTFELAEKAARSEKRGIWQQDSPTPPWTYREQFYNADNSSTSGGYLGNSGTSDSNNSNKTVQVRGYYRQDGTYVRPHTRSAPNSASGGRKRN